MAKGPKVKSQGKKKRTKRPVSKKSKAFQVTDNKITRLRKICPKCGAGVYLAQHENREACGKCGYTQFLKKA